MKWVHLLLLVLLVSAQGNEEEYCTIFGRCDPCPSKEMQSDACAQTGRRATFRCVVITNGTEETEYNEMRSCRVAAISTIGSFWIFEGCMAVMLGLATVVMIRRKRLVQSLHDRHIARLVNS